jgi:phenylpyruvate tautomerase PptA (4-oxalocrotonate tautomerase family)
MEVLWKSGMKAMEQKAALVRGSTQLLVDVLKEKARIEMIPLRETAAQ